MELQQLKYFMVTAKYQHMTKAAQSLHIAQPALSQSIKRLEAELGTSLFLRSGRNIRLSGDGQLLQEKLAPILSALDELPAMLDQSKNTANHTIRLNVLSASEIVTKIIVAYKDAHPDVLFRLSQKADDYDWDVRVSDVPLSAKGSVAHRVLKEEIYLAVPQSSPFASANSIRLEQAEKASFISLDQEKPFSVLTKSYCQSCGFDPNIVFQSDNPATVRELIGAGLGVAFWPKYSWGEAESANVKLLHITNPRCSRQLYVSKNSRKPSSPLENDFHVFLSDYLTKLQYS